MTTYASIEGNDNFTEEYTYNLQVMLAARVGKRLHLFFSPAVHLNSNGQRRFDWPEPATGKSSTVQIYEIPASTAVAHQ